MKVTCPVCRTDFMQTSSNNKYCSKQCGDNWFLGLMKDRVIKQAKEEQIDLVQMTKKILFRGM